jgi:hypothetical protein
MTDSNGACRCGHAFEAHEHYRSGTDCGICGNAVCPAYQADPKVPRADSEGPDTGSGGRQAVAGG